MATEVNLSADSRYVLVTHTGALLTADMVHARSKSLPLYDGCDRTLVDFRSANLSRISVLELDDLGRSFRQEVPGCRRMAIVSGLKTGTFFYTHLVNLLKINGVAAEMFIDISVAKAWLLNEGELLG